LLDSKELGRLEFKEVRGMKGIKKAEVEIGGKKLRVAVVATKVNIDLIMEELKKDPDAYHYIELMACPGGCIGGGGQPIPSTDRIIKQRIAGLYGIDDKSVIRRAHENPMVRDFMTHYIAALPKEERSALLHTNYRKRERGE
jgi:NADP-reducing hydrogenase subunit HndD